jgi:negative regulator of flagellin synthesis FlgM
MRTLFVKDLTKTADINTRIPERSREMVIDKIGNINNIVEPKSARSVSKTKEAGKSDSIEISSEAKKAAELSRYTQIVKEAPDIRADRVKEIKERIQDGTYDKFTDDKVLEMVAEKIAMHLLRK